MSLLKYKNSILQAKVDRILSISIEYFVSQLYVGIGFNGML